MAIIPFSFLGKSCEGGVDERMAQALSRVEASLREVYSQSGTNDSFEAWCQIHETHKGFHVGGYHGQGIAIDINYTTNPYIATRTGQTFGGEFAPGDRTPMRRLALQACDWACQFASSSSDWANLAGRDTSQESIGYVYDRFKFVSDSLAFYFWFVFSADAKQIQRPPVPNAETVDLWTLEASIPRTERVRDRAEAIDLIHAYLQSSDEFAEDGTLIRAGYATRHPGWGTDRAGEADGTAGWWYDRILRDYEHVRTPMLFGSASGPVTRTRNPARGFLDLRRELVVALVEIGGMSWGACDFAPGVNGDMMHFDLGRH
jgi:hypothetical protein